MNKRNKNKYIRDTIVPCLQTGCPQKLCPNYSNVQKRNGFFFPDCMYNPNRLNKSTK